ncbi:MAG: hypothetical protein LQ340_005662 [Diploschistes diacapsis]|nr:MAG: hypothetical protein LQ340_005662 [Diploschistes diacapsis]
MWDAHPSWRHQVHTSNRTKFIFLFSGSLVAYDTYLFLTLVGKHYPSKYQQPSVAELADWLEVNALGVPRPEKVKKPKVDSWTIGLLKHTGSRLMIACLCLGLGLNIILIVLGSSERLQLKVKVSPFVLSFLGLILLLYTWANLVLVFGTKMQCSRSLRLAAHTAGASQGCLLITSTYGLLQSNYGLELGAYGLSSSLNVFAWLQRILVTLLLLAALCDFWISNHREHRLVRKFAEALKQLRGSIGQCFGRLKQRRSDADNADIEATPQLDGTAENRGDCSPQISGTATLSALAARIRLSRWRASKREVKAQSDRKSPKHKYADEMEVVVGLFALVFLIGVFSVLIFTLTTKSSPIDKKNAAHIANMVALVVVGLLLAATIAGGLVRLRQTRYSTEELSRRDSLLAPSLVKSRRESIPATDMFTFEHNSVYSTQTPRSRFMSPAMSGASSPIRSPTRSRRGTTTVGCRAPQIEEQDFAPHPSISEAVSAALLNRKSTVGLPPAVHAPMTRNAAVHPTGQEPPRAFGAPTTALADPSLGPPKRRPTVTFALDGRSPSPPDEHEDEADWETTSSSTHPGEQASPHAAIAAAARMRSHSLDGSAEEAGLMERGGGDGKEGGGRSFPLSHVEVGNGMHTVRAPRRQPRLSVLSVIKEDGQKRSGAEEKPGGPL